MANKIEKIGLFFHSLGFILFLFVGVIFWAVYIIDGIINFKFLIIYTAYVIYVFLTLLYSSLSTGFFKLDSEEKEELTKLKMNHSLTLSLPLIIFSTQFLSLEFLKGERWLFFVIGLVLLFIGFTWFVKGYFIRFIKLKRKYENRH